MTCADAGIDDSFAFAVTIPLADVRRAYFEFERRGDAIVDLIMLIREVLTVRVQINETGRYEEAVGVERGFTGKRRGGDGGNPVALDAYVPNGVEVGFPGRSPGRHE